MSTKRKTALFIEGGSAAVAALRGAAATTNGLVSTLAKETKEAMKKVYLQRFDLVILDLDQVPEADRFLEQLNSAPKDFRPVSVCVLVADPAKVALNLPTGGKLVKRGESAADADRILRDLLGETTAVKVDVEFILPFIDGVMHVLETMANTKSERKELFVRAGTQISGDISAVIAMNSAGFQGSMAISFEAACFLGIVNQMLGESYTAVTAENADAAGEICNQVFGYAKVKLNSIGHSIQPAIPTVVTGKSHTIKHLVNGPCLAVRFSTPHGQFTVEAVIQAPKGAAA